MKPIKVNGVVVRCGDCVNWMTSPEDEPCRDCWKAIFHIGDESEIHFEDISFYPKDKDHFLAVERLVKKYESQFIEMKKDAKAHGVSMEELCKQFANRRTLAVWIDGIK